MKRSSGYNRTLVQLLYICAYCFAGSKRGPKFGRLWKCQLFLLGKCNDDFIPSTAEQARLTRNGMGRLTCVLALLCSFHCVITPLNNLSVFSLCHCDIQLSTDVRITCTQLIRIGMCMLQDLFTYCNCHTNI